MVPQIREDISHVLPPQFLLICSSHRRTLCGSWSNINGARSIRRKSTKQWQPPQLHHAATSVRVSTSPYEHGIHAETQGSQDLGLKLLRGYFGNFDVAWQPLWHTNGVFDDIFCIYGTLILAATTSVPPWCRGRPRTSLALGSIAFYSKCLNPGQCKYSTYNQELLACVLGIKKFQYFLEGQHLIFTLDFSSQTHV